MQKGAASMRLQADLDRRRAGRHRPIVLPAPGHYDTVGRIHGYELADRDVLAVDIDAHPASRPWIQLGADTHPGRELTGLDKIREHRHRGRRDFMHDLDGRATLDQLFDRFLSSASAS